MVHLHPSKSALCIQESSIKRRGNATLEASAKIRLALLARKQKAGERTLVRFKSVHGEIYCLHGKKEHSKTPWGKFKWVRRRDLRFPSWHARNSEPMLLQDVLSLTITSAFIYRHLSNLLVLLVSNNVYLCAIFESIGPVPYVPQFDGEIQELAARLRHL
jgi:hypothetical protein